MMMMVMIMMRIATPTPPLPQTRHNTQTYGQQVQRANRGKRHVVFHHQPLQSMGKRPRR